MFRHTIPIGRVLGIPIDLDYSWFLIAALITWMLAVSYYPVEFKGGTSIEYWLMGAVTAVLFFSSIVVHELAHSWVASLLILVKLTPAPTADGDNRFGSQSLQ